MRKQNLLIMLSCLLLVSVGAFAQKVHITTGNSSLVLDAQKGKALGFLYYGDRIGDDEIENVAKASSFKNVPAYPVYGMSCSKEAALSLVHPDGSMATELAVENTERTSEPNGATVTKVMLKDKVYELYVNVCYRTYPGLDIIETWTEITNREKGMVRMTKFASAALPLQVGDVHVSHLAGAWGNESRVLDEKLDRGMFVIKNRDGVRNSHLSHAEVMISLDGKAREEEGRVIGAALCYSGNYKLRFDTEDYGYHSFIAGINEEDSEYHLKKGETFQTPVLALTFSHEGLGGASRSFHRWARKYKLAHGDRLRKVLLNSWEGVYLDIKEKEMDQMMADIESMGGELFVMDDGWFGAKYRRTVDDCALGDWTVDTNKLPHGINGLLESAKSHNVSFGIWIEPEMTNTKSELYEKHPEYVIKAPLRDPRPGRGGTQLVLDMSNPKVQDIVFQIVDTLLTKYPAIGYIKWDANCDVKTHGSTYLTSDDQSHLFIEYHRGLEKTLKRIRTKYPDVTIQACASGGGRANYGVLPYFDEFWTSDDTDALQRVYIQWGTSYFFPSMAMACHISASPNHQTGRLVSLKYRIDVAMSGRLGMEIQPRAMEEWERDMCRKAIEEYKQVRPVIQLGDQYRLLSPYDGKQAASMMYVDPDKTRAVFFWWKTETFIDQHLPRVPMAGLDRNRTYRVHELNRIDSEPLSYEGLTFKGSFLMDNGLDIPLEHKAKASQTMGYSSRVLLLEEVK